MALHRKRGAAKRAAKRSGANAGTTRRRSLVASMFSAILALCGALQALGEFYAVHVSGGRRHALGCAESTRAEAD
jgi:CobQ-like glutamine amidotransferase family enzyme